MIVCEQCGAEYEDGERHKCAAAPIDIAKANREFMKGLPSPIGGNPPFSPIAEHASKRDEEKAELNHPNPKPQTPSLTIRGGAAVAILRFAQIARANPGARAPMALNIGETLLAEIEASQ
jgi:hypothetical protein